MGYEEFSVSMANRSIRTIKAELEFLADNSLITRQQLSTMLSQLPSETPIHVDSTTAATNGINNLSLSNGVSNTPTPIPTRSNEKQTPAFNDNYAPPPPAYGSNPPPPPAPSAPPVLAHAVSMYPYSGTDAGDLALQTNDRIAVMEYMNAEWWKGRNERTGAEGIFPRSYVRLDEKSAPGSSAPQPSNYGNAPLDVAQGAQSQQPQDPHKKGTAAKIGGKLGNAAIFGAGATIGSNLVNSIF